MRFRCMVGTIYGQIQPTRVGETVGEKLYARYAHLDQEVGGSLAVRPSAVEALLASLKVVSQAALPTERRANILRGIVTALERCGALGGEPEWAGEENEQELPDVTK